MTGYEPLIVERDWNRITDRDWVPVLAGLPVFSRLSKRQLRRLARQAEFREFAPGDTVIATGAPPDSFYVILSGEASVRGKPGARALSLGDFFGEIGLLGNMPRTATVLATSELHVMRVPGRAFLELVEQDAGVAHTVLMELGARLRRAERQQAPAL